MLYSSPHAYWVLTGACNPMLCPVHVFRYAPRKKFMKLKEFVTPFDEPPPLMELHVIEDEPLPVLCVGCTRDKTKRTKQLAIVNPNHPPDRMAKHMSAELGWVRVRAGREDCFATAVKQIGILDLGLILFLTWA